MRRRCLACRTLIARGSYCAAHARKGSTRQWRGVRAQVLFRDRWTCQQCGAPADHVDHIAPVIDGGTDHPANLRALCARCNLDRR